MEFNNIQEYSDYFEQVKEITNNYFDKYKSVSRVQFFAPNLVKLRNLFII